MNIDDENTSGTTAESLLGIPVTRTRQRLHIDRVRKSCWLNLLDAVDEPQQRFNYVRNFWQHNEISDTLAEFEPMVVKTRSDDANSHIRAEMKRIRKHLGSVVLEQDDDADEDDGDEDDDDGDRDIEKIGKIDEKTKQGFSEGKQCKKNVNSSIIK